jgi:hypothetical protein
VYSRESGHIGCYLIDQAHVGPLNDRIEQRLWNQINAELEKSRKVTGLGYRVRCIGSRDFCIKYARSKGWRDV